MAIARIYDVWHDSWKMRRCGENLEPGRGCGAVLWFVEVVKTGKRVPFDGPAQPTPKATHDRDGRLIDVMDTSLTPTHFGTCPKRMNFRKNDPPRI